MPRGAFDKLIKRLYVISFSEFKTMILISNVNA